MCGIAGASLSPKDQVNAKRIAKAMLLEIEHRGRDATGFAFRDSNGQFQVHKRDIDATQFVKRNLCLPKDSRTFIMHTRFATQGDPMFNENNHPILTAGIVGVHNGHVSNDWELFRDIDDALALTRPDSIRIGEVDSEAVFALLGYLDYDGDKAPKLLEKVRGGAAVAWMNAADESDALYLARLNSSPLIIGETDSGSLLFASTQEAVEAGANVAGLTLKMIRDIPEGTYMRVLDGEYVDVRMFEPAKWYSSTYNYIGKSPTKGITDRFSSRGINKDWDDADDFDWYAPGMHPNMTHEERTYQYVMGKATEAPRATVTSLSDRLAQEEPDVAVDSSDESYEEWWRLNTEANEAAWDRAVNKENDRDAESQRRHNEFAAFTRSPYLNSYYLSNIEYPVRVPSEVVYLSEPRNMRRDDSIREWMKCVQGNEDNKSKAAFFLKADVFPGFPVSTDVDGIEVFGHLVELPETFPSGDYLIRAYIPRPKRKTGYEAIFVARQYHEFDVCQFSETAESEIPKKGTELVKVKA